MPPPFRIFFEFEIWISWIIGLLCFLSAWLRRPSTFKVIGRSKLVWMGVTALGFVPFAGIIPALVYFFRVWRYLPGKEHGFWRQMKASWDSVPTQRSSGSGTPARSNHCNMCRDGTQRCTGCGGGMNASGCVYCGGSGKTACQYCHGANR
jgi:hypothetical protein